MSVIEWISWFMKMLDIDMNTGSITEYFNTGHFTTFVYRDVFSFLWSTVLLIYSMHVLIFIFVRLCMKSHLMCVCLSKPILRVVILKFNYYRCVCMLNLKEILSGMSVYKNKAKPKWFLQCTWCVYMYHTYWIHFGLLWKELVSRFQIILDFIRLSLVNTELKL